jgi:hypothetical protein
MALWLQLPSGAFPPCVPVRWINRTVPNLPVPPTDSSNNHGSALASGATCFAAPFLLDN